MDWTLACIILYILSVVFVFNIQRFQGFYDWKTRAVIIFICLVWPIPLIIISWYRFWMFR